MTTLAKILVTTLLGLVLFSCNFDMNLGPGVKGNGNVTTEERTLDQSFDAIEVSRGLDVYLTQSSNESLTVEADENLHDIIITEVVNNTLKIYADENISYSKAKKVMVNFNHVNTISSTSGSDVYGTTPIKEETLVLTTTSGSDMELEVVTTNLECKSTSGSDLKLSGQTKSLKAVATSGSDIKAGNLIAESSTVNANSGADITVNTSKKLVAKATSGGDIKYYGNPENVEKSDGPSGSISKQ